MTICSYDRLMVICAYVYTIVILRELQVFLASAKCFVVVLHVFEFLVAHFHVLVMLCHF